MFWIVCDPSWGSMELYLTETIRSGSQMFVVCLLGVWQRFWTSGVCVRSDGPYTHTTGSKTLPNTEQAHDKHLWTTTNSFSQVQLHTPSWWIAYDPKHVGVIFNFVSFRLLYNVDFNLQVLYNWVHLVGQWKWLTVIMHGENLKLWNSQLPGWKFYQ